MTLLVTLLIALLPLSAFAERIHREPPPQRGTVVIPDGQGGVTYWQAQGGTDAYTAGQIGQGLTQEFQRTRRQEPLSVPPPLDSTPVQERHKLSDDDAWRQSLSDFLSR